MSDNMESTQPIRMFTFSRNQEEFEQQVARVKTWVEALYSGEYRKNHSNKLKDEEGYNVFGVAIEVCKLSQKAEGTYRPEAYRELGLTTAIGHHYNREERCNGNLLDYKPECRDFIDVASLIEFYFVPAVNWQERWFAAMESENPSRLFDPELLKDDKVQNRITDWILALRSGEYKQGQHALECDGKFCCLGVANVVCDLAEKNEGTLEHTYEKLGLQTKNGDWSSFLSLTHVNDSENWTFDMIADFIEKERALASKQLTATNS